jgi:Carboxypeptidase regulatory-like domain/TonB dependent receptor
MVRRGLILFRGWARRTKAFDTHALPAAMPMHTRRWLLTGALLLASAAMDPRIAVQAQSQQPPSVPSTPADQNSGPGRVVATITALEGSVHVPGVEVELQAEDGMTIAKTLSDTTGQVSFPDVPPGRYRLRATRLGFGASDSAAFNVRRGETTQVLVDISLTFVAPGVEVVSSAPPPAKAATPPPTLPSPTTMTIQPVASSDMMTGNVLDLAPLPGDDFQSLLPMLPGVVRGPDGRLRIKGGQPTQGALQVSSASLVDPSTGDFDLQLPGQSIESVEVLANPFAAEYGRFSTSVTQIRTTRGTNEWKIKPGNLVPRPRGDFSGLRAFEPRLSIRGPLQRDRLFLSQDLQFRYVTTPVRSLPDEPEIKLKSFDLFTRLDGVISSRHTLGGGLIMFPREVEHLGMDTFRPAPVTPDLNQSGAATGLLDRFALATDVVLETTLAVRRFELSVNTGDDADPAKPPMTYSPETQSGVFFNDQERDVYSVQWVEAVSVSRDYFGGEHVFKFGTDLQISGYDGESLSRPLESRRLDGSLAERIEFANPLVGAGNNNTTLPGASRQEVNGTEFAIFAQDRWRVTPRMTLELGFRMDRDDVVQKVNWSPRAGVSIGVLPDGRGILRGGVGKFLQRTPLNVGAFGQFETRTVTRFAADGTMIGAPVLLRHVSDGNLKTPEATVGNIEWDQRFGRRVIVKASYLRRKGSHEYILNPETENGLIRLSSSGHSRYWEFETTARYLGSGRKDISISYVRSHGTADLNNYDSFYGNLRTPFVRPNENNLIPHDVPHRLLIRGLIGLGAKWDVAPVLELRSGFPWSAVDEFQDFVGARSRAGRLPAVRTFDIAVTRPFRFKKYTFRAGIRAFNLFGASADRDVQVNTTSPNFGRFFNPIERSIGFVIGSSR